MQHSVALQASGSSPACWRSPSANASLKYTTGDTVFIDVPSRQNTSADSAFLEYHYFVHENHMPGTYWCTPPPHACLSQCPERGWSMPVNI